MSDQSVLSYAEKYPHPGEPPDRSEDALGYKHNKYVQACRKHYMAKAVDDLKAEVSGNFDTATPIQRIAFIIGADFLDPVARAVDSPLSLFGL